jgi:hypothetical protein
VSCNNIYLIVSEERRSRRPQVRRDPLAILLPFVCRHGFALVVSWMLVLELSTAWKIAIVSAWALYGWLLYRLFRSVMRRRHSGGTK